MTDIAEEIAGVGSILYCPRCGNGETSHKDCDFCTHGNGARETIIANLEAIFNPKSEVVEETIIEVEVPKKAGRPRKFKV